MYPQYFINDKGVMYKVDEPICFRNNKKNTITVSANVTAMVNGKVIPFLSPQIQVIENVREEDAIQYFENHLFYRLGRSIDSEAYIKNNDLEKKDCPKGE